MMGCPAILLTTSGESLPCLMGELHVDTVTHLTLDDEGNILRWDEPVEVAS